MIISGTELFRDFIWSTNVVDIDIAPSNKYVAVAEVNCSGILIQSNIKIISIEKATKHETEDAVIYKSSAKEGALIINMQYQTGDRLIAVYDNHIESICDNEVEEIDYSQEDVSFVDVNNKIIKIVNKNSKIVLQVISNDLKDIKEYEIEELKALSVYENVISLNLGTEIRFYNNSGWLIKKYYTNQEVNKITISNNLAGIIYNDKIELISL